MPSSYRVAKEETLLPSRGLSSLAMGGGHAEEARKTSAGRAFGRAG